MKFYNEDLLKIVMEEAEDLIYFFGYAKHQDNPTAVFEFADPKSENIEKHYGFQKWNADNLKLVLESPDARAEYRYLLKNFQTTTALMFPFFDYGVKLETTD